MSVPLLRAFAWIIMTLPATALAAGFVVPEQYHGTYSGLDLTSVEHGVPWEDSLTTLEIDAHGLTLYAHRDRHERQWKIRYSNEWLLLPHERCLGIKRSLDIESPKVIPIAFALCFEEVDAKGLRLVRMTTAQAEPLGEYIMNVDAQDNAALWALRDRFDQIGAEALPSLVRPPSARDLLSTVTGHDQRLKIAALREMRDYVAELPEPEVAHYFDAILFALDDAEPIVQEAAIATIEKAALFTYAVAPLRALIDRPEPIKPTVLAAAVRALGALIHEANQLFERREAFRRAFGTIDMDEIFERTEGIIEANDAPSSLLGIFKLHPPPSRAWTPELRNDMLRTLDRVAREEASPEIRQDADRITRYLGKTLPVSEDGCQSNLGGTVRTRENEVVDLTGIEPAT